MWVCIVWDWRVETGSGFFSLFGGGMVDGVFFPE